MVIRLEAIASNKKLSSAFPTPSCSAPSCSAEALARHEPSGVRLSAAVFAALARLPKLLRPTWRLLEAGDLRENGKMVDSFSCPVCTCLGC